MKNLKPILIILTCFFLLSFQDQEIDEANPTPTQIAGLLDAAERSINEMQFDKAQEYLDKSIEYSKRIDHQRFIALSSSILARMYQVRHEYDKGITHLERAISIQREIEDDEGLAYSYLLYGKLLTSKRDYDRAQNYLDLAQVHYQRQDDEEQIGIVALNKAIAFLSSRNLQQGKKQLDIAIKHLKKSENTYELSRLHYYMARANTLEGDFDSAEKNAQASLQISQSGEHMNMSMYSYGLLSEIEEVRGNHKAALNYLQKNNEIREGVFDMNKEALDNESNAKLGVDALKTTVDELTLQNAEQERTLKVNKLTTILSVALITILSLLTLSLYKNNNLRARANDLLQKKNSELILAKENAEKASMAKVQFLSTITHELRTPLYAVTGLTHLLLEENPSESQKEHLNSLKFSGEYLLSLINNILDLNKLEANKVEVVNTEFDLKKRMSDVMVALKNSADEKNTNLHFDFGDQIPHTLIGDPLKLSQVLINLIGNSIKFTDNGDIWISVTEKQREENMLSLIHI